MKNKFTPGPWIVQVNKYNKHELLVKTLNASNRIISSFGSEEEPLDETDKANARLIAAGPEMYAMLNKILKTGIVSNAYMLSLLNRIDGE